MAYSQTDIYSKWQLR